MPSIYASITPPEDTSLLWLDQSLAGSYVSGAPQDHVVVLPGDGSTYYQEACAFETGNYTYVVTFSTNTSAVGFVYMTPTPLLPESYVLLGNITLPAPYNGNKDYCAHPQIRVIDNQLVLTGADVVNSPNSIRMFTAPIPTPGSLPVFTYQSQIFTLTTWGGTQFGNTDVFKLTDGRYVMSIEAYISNNWNQGYAISSSLTSGYAALSNGNESLQLMQNAPLGSATGAGSGGNCHFVENNTIVQFFAGGKLVGEIYRAKQAFPGTTDFLNWENLDGDWPLVKRGLHPSWQIDQTADPYVLSNGTQHLLFYTAISNGGGLFSIMVTPLMPTLRIYQRGVWIPIHAGRDQQARTWNRPIFVADANYIAQPGDEVFFYGLSANRNITMPIAGNTASVRVHVAGDSAYTVTPKSNASNNKMTGVRDKFRLKAGGALTAAGADGDAISAGEDVTFTAICTTSNTVWCRTP